MWVIYGPNTTDFPGKYVVRAWEIRRGQAAGAQLEATTWPSLPTARTAVPRGLFKLLPSPNDDPVILETWI